MLTKMCRDCVHYEVCAHKVDTDANMDGVCEHFKPQPLRARADRRQRV